VLEAFDWVEINAFSGDWPIFCCYHCAYDIKHFPELLGCKGVFKMRSDQVVPGPNGHELADGTKVWHPTRTLQAEMVSSNIEQQRASELTKARNTDAVRLMGKTIEQTLGSSVVTKLSKNPGNVEMLGALQLISQMGAIVPQDVTDQLPNLNQASNRFMVLQTGKPDEFRIAVETRQ
jgi:hypothetical protein